MRELLAAFAREVVSFLQLNIKRVIASIILGIAIGLSVTLIHFLISEILQSWFITKGSSLLFVLLVPAFGLFMAGLAIKSARTSNKETVEEMVQAYHRAGGIMSLRALPAKIGASIITIGLGGSAGLEGPSIYVGSSLGSFLGQKGRPFGLRYRDIRILMISGAAAGVSAIFKAPLTGVVFALGLPYKDDLVHEALLPSLITSVISYLTIASFIGFQPLFYLAHAYTQSFSDSLMAIPFGLLIGIAALCFTYLFHHVNKFSEKIKISLPLKGLIGGFIVGLLGLVSLLFTQKAYVLGPGYELVANSLSGTFSPFQLIPLFILKAAATIFTLASSGVGGIFIPLISMGSLLGGFFGELVGARIPLWTALGMAAFLAAGYKAPLAAVTFVAETTGNPSFIIPSLIASAVAYVLSGSYSVSEYQKSRRESHLEMVLALKVKDLMTKKVATTIPDLTLRELVDERILKYHHKVLPVVDSDGELMGIISRGDISNVPKEQWSDTKVNDAMRKEVVTFSPDQKISQIVEVLYEKNIFTAPVVDKAHPSKLLGIISLTDIVKREELARLAREKE